MVMSAPPSRTVARSDCAVSPAHRVEREINLAHALGHILLGVVDVLVGAKAEHEIAVAR